MVGFGGIYTVAENTLKRTARRFEKDILPFFATYKPNSSCLFDDVISSKDIKEIKHTELLEAVLLVENRGATDTVSKIMGECNRLWLFAINSVPQYAESNIVSMIDRKHALKKVPKKHYPSTTNAAELKQYMEFATRYDRGFVSKYALQLLPYLFLRNGNIRNLEWSEIDFEKKTITISAEKMKVKKNGKFVLPLPLKAICILNAVKPYTYHSRYVFPSPQNKAMPMSDNTLSKALRDNGFAGIITPHGFRSVFSSLAYENSNIHGLSHKVIEACLHHSERNEVAAAYNYNAKYLTQMTILMTWWADYLDSMLSI